MSPDQFLQIADLFPDPALLLSRDGDVLAANRAYKSLGCPDPGEKNLADLIRNPREELEEYLRLCSRSSNPVLGSIELTTAIATSIACHAHGAVIHRDTDTGEVRLVIRLMPKGSPSDQFAVLNEKVDQLSQEIRRRIQTEDQLREQSNWLRVTLASIGDGVMTTDDQGRVTYLNPVASELTGWPLEEAVERPLEEVFRIFHETTREVAENPADQALREGVVVGLANHTMLINRAGHEIPIDDSAAPIRDESNGQIAGVVLVFREVSERKRVELESKFLAEAGAALAALVDEESTLQLVAGLAVPFFSDWCAVDLVGKDGSLRRLAVAHRDPDLLPLVEELQIRYPHHPDTPYVAPNVLRTGQAEMMSEIPDSLLIEIAQDADHLRIMRVLQPRTYICVPMKVRDQVLGTITFYRSEPGTPYGTRDLAVGSELAHRAAVAIENARLYGELREADARKDEFLAVLAHELRNPLAPIRTGLHVLKKPTASAADQAHAREMVERQLEHAVRLVDDLLDLSRILRGKVELHREPVELGTIFAAAVQFVRPTLDAEGHELTVSLPEEQLWLDGDATRLAQLVGNLLQNAAKYTDRGGRVWLTGERDGEWAVIRVRDNGIGIPREMLARIWGMFVQVDRCIKESRGGLGIGLSIARRLAELHSGQVEAHSDGPGTGSEFVVRLPLLSRHLSCDPNHAGSNEHGHSRSVLVVDDNVDAAETLALLLRLGGHDVRVAYDGESALRLAQADPPDAAFLDIGMPGMDGYELARRFRSTLSLRGVLLVAVTGWGLEEDRRRTRDAGFDAHEVKPVDPDTLEALLAGQLPNRR